MKQVFNELRNVPAAALREIEAGTLRGKSDINPMWRMMRLTEIFGICGFGWRYEITKQWFEQGVATTKAFCNINLYVRDPETKEWSEAIPGTGGSEFVSQNGKDNDECYKMALTDALSVAMKALGVAADVYMGSKGQTIPFDSKYAQFCNIGKDASKPTSAKTPKASKTTNTSPELEALNKAADTFTKQAEDFVKSMKIEPEPVQVPIDKQLEAIDAAREEEEKNHKAVIAVIRGITNTADLKEYHDSHSQYHKFLWFKNTCNEQWAKLTKKAK